jgi:hypothetical protein
MAERDFRENKTARAAAPPKTLGHFTHFLSASVSTEAKRERAGGRPERRHRPLADVRRSPEGERAAVEPARGSALRWRPEPTRRRPDKRRRTRGPEPFPESVVFNDGRSGHGGAAVTPRHDCRHVLRRVQAATVPMSDGSRRAPSRRPKWQIRHGVEVWPRYP